MKSNMPQYKQQMKYLFFLHHMMLSLTAHLSTGFMVLPNNKAGIVNMPLATSLNSHTKTEMKIYKNFNKP